MFNITFVQRNTWEILSDRAQAATVVPTKSDSDLILCLQLLSKTLTFTLNLS